MRGFALLTAFISILLIGVNSDENDIETATDEIDLELKRHPRETNVLNFVRLLVMRLIYGFAQMFGFEESISEIGDGALVPPGADDYGIGDDLRDDDYGMGDDLRDYGDDYY